MTGDVSALILAGGKATRFGGIAKHELVVDGETIFQRQVRVLEPVATEILVSSPKPIPGHRHVVDAIEGAGPLAGIAAGLAACRTKWLLVVAGDMPYITPELIGALIEPLRADTDAVGVQLAGLPEPLVCVLHRRVLPNVQRRLASGDYKASRLLTDDELTVHWIEPSDPIALRNINSPEDLGP
jgi:molybdopterin-guanine dinucleotide biosynthesis protein A